MIQCNLSYAQIMKQNAPVWRLEPTPSNDDSLDLDFKICLWPKKVAEILERLACRHFG